MNNFQKTLCSVLEQQSESLEFISTGLNKLKIIYKGVVYESYSELPKTARFAIARSIQPYAAVYTKLRESYGVIEAEERLCWCLFGSFDAYADIFDGQAHVEIASHCESCQYEKPFCNRVLSHLTQRQQECFLLMKKGMTDKEVANVLGISYLTVIKHMNNAVERIREISGSNITRQYIINQLNLAGL